MQDDSTEEGRRYKQMKNALIRIRHQNSKKRLLAMASDWYATVQYVVCKFGCCIFVGFDLYQLLLIFYFDFFIYSFCFESVTNQ